MGRQSWGYRRASLQIGWSFFISRFSFPGKQDFSDNHEISIAQIAEEDHRKTRQNEVRAGQPKDRQSISFANIILMYEET
jgi:hypothetical protein